MTPARKIARLQLEYYNARDLNRFCALFSQDAVLENYKSGEIVASSPTEIREFYAQRFAYENLHCIVNNEIDLGEISIDYETITGVGGKPMDVIAIYHIQNEKIVRLSFIR